MLRWLFSIVFLGLVFGCPQSNGAEAGPDSQAWQLQVVELTLHQIPLLLDHDPAALHFFTFNGKRFQNIPWQWDAVGEDGKILLEDRILRKFRKADTLLWMFSDMGERATPAQIKDQLKRWKLNIADEKIPSALEVQIDMPGSRSKMGICRGGPGTFSLTQP